MSLVCLRYHAPPRNVVDNGFHIALILGVDRFMSEMRSLTNLVGNSVATIVVARWENQFDSERAAEILHLKRPTAHEAVAALD